MKKKGERALEMPLVQRGWCNSDKLFTFSEVQAHVLCVTILLRPDVGFIIIIISIVDRKMFSSLGFSLWALQLGSEGARSNENKETGMGKKGSILFFRTIYFFWKYFKDKNIL